MPCMSEGASCSCVQVSRDQVETRGKCSCQTSLCQTKHHGVTVKKLDKEQRCRNEDCDFKEWLEQNFAKFPDPTLWVPSSSLDALNAGIAVLVKHTWSIFTSDVIYNCLCEVTRSCDYPPSNPRPCIGVIAVLLLPSEPWVTIFHFLK